MGVWVLAFECTIGCDYANEMACFSISRRTISRREEDTKTGGSKLRIWGSEVRILPGAPARKLKQLVFLLHRKIAPDQKRCLVWDLV
jgi:hypothetical protein